MVIVGIDPGLRGGWARLDMAGDLIKAGRMPVRIYGGRKANSIDAKALYNSLRMPFKDSRETIGVIESVHAMPAQGVTSSFTFGASFSAALTLLDIVCWVSPYLVTPQVWKKHFDLKGKNKRGSLELCAELWPTGGAAEVEWGVLANEGVAEAALIARWYLDTRLENE